MIFGCLAGTGGGTYPCVWREDVNTVTLVAEGSQGEKTMKPTQPNPCRSGPASRWSSCWLSSSSSRCSWAWSRLPRTRS